MFWVNVDFNVPTYVPVSKTTRPSAVSSVKHTHRLFHHSVDLEANTNNKHSALCEHRLHISSTGNVTNARCDEPVFTNTMTYFSNPPWLDTIIPAKSFSEFAHFVLLSQLIIYATWNGARPDSIVFAERSSDRKFDWFSRLESDYIPGGNQSKMPASGSEWRLNSKPECFEFLDGAVSTKWRLHLCLSARRDLQPSALLF